MRALALFATSLLLVTTLWAPASGRSYDDAAVATGQTDGTGLVRAITTIGNVVYVGGSFAGVRSGPGAPLVNQPWLAALDATTGTPLPGFAPQLDGEVWALEPAADGSRLYVGGRFSTVNGAARVGLVALDPSTGATDPGFVTSLNRGVHDLARDGTHLYLAGRFWRVNGERREKVARVSLATGAVDSWAPLALGGTAYSVAVEPVLDRVYVGGFFGSVDNVPGTEQLAAVSRTTGSVITTFAPDPDAEVYDIAATPAKVYVALGGIGGRVEVYDTGSGATAASWFGDGDLQAVALAGDKIYVGGHHEGSFGAAATGFVNELDALTDQVDPDFTPPLSARTGFGVWAVHAAADHLWVGGAVTGAGPVPAVGIARFPVDQTGGDDTTAPTTPSGLRLDYASDTTVRLSWDPSSDDSGLVSYVVERDGTLLGGSSQATYTDATVAADTTYQYRVTAVDPSGNTSTASAPLGVTTLPALTETVVIPFGSTWRYPSSGAPGPNWTLAGYDDSGWASGPAQLGFGDGDEATVLPWRLVHYFRNDVDVAPGTIVGSATLRVMRDDGVAVHVNGTEVVRDNLPTGPLGDDTSALTSIFGAREDEVLEFAVDPALFTTGANVIAASVHNRGASSDMTFDAELVLRITTATEPDTQPPTPPGDVAAAEVTATTATVVWTAATDDVAVDHYEVSLDGAPVATTTALGHTVTGLAPETGYTLDVVAVDAAGNRSTGGGPVAITTLAPPTGPLTLVDFGASWRYLDSGVDPGPGWAAAGYDDAAWASGPAEIGAGDGDEITAISNQVVVYLRRSVIVDDPSAFTTLTLDLLADDGAIVYVNGVEVMRDNLPAGPIGAGTNASTYRWGAAERTPNTFVLPVSAFVPGPNTIAIGLHNAPGSTDMSFDARAVLS